MPTRSRSTSRATSWKARSATSATTSTSWPTAPRTLSRKAASHIMRPRARPTSARLPRLPFSCSGRGTSAAQSSRLHPRPAAKRQRRADQHRRPQHRNRLETGRPLYWRQSQPERLHPPAPPSGSVSAPSASKASWAPGATRQK